MSIPVRLLFALILVILAVPLPASEQPQFKVRALWVDSSGFSSPEATDKMIATCQRAGINMILPNVLLHQSLFHKSTHFLHKVAANEKYDPLADMIRKAHAVGIQVHPWYCVYYEGGTTPAKPEWLCTDMNGKPISSQIFISPEIPGVNDYLLSVIRDGLAYDIDGIHLDYIRYPNTTYDYSEAGRKRFAESFGFDPLDFLDHAERIVPLEKDPFPIRMLRTNRQIERSWEVSWAERLFDWAGVGFGLISEKPESIDALKAPGLLVLNCCYEVSPEMRAALGRYMQRGGNLLWIDTPATSLAKDPALVRMLGIRGGKWVPRRVMTMKPVADHPLARLVPEQPFYSYGELIARPGSATVIAQLDTGEPVLSVNAFGKGRAVVLGLSPAEVGTAALPRLVRGISDWLRSQSGVAPGPDLLAARRAQWVRWRGEQVTALVRGIAEAAKAKDPRIAISSSGGPNPAEYYICYRDARRWMAEGLTQLSFPMNYTDSPDALREILKAQRSAATPGTEDRIFPGLSIYTGKTVNGKRTVASQDPKIVEKQLQLVREAGYRGFVLFAYTYLTEDQIKVIRKFAN